MPFDFSSYRVASGEKPASSTKFNNFLQAVQDGMNAMPAANLLGFPSDASKFLDGAGGWSTPVTDLMARYVKTTQTDITSTVPGDLFGGGITIAANTLLATGALRMFAFGLYANTSGSNRTLTLRLKLGTVTIWDSGPSDIIATMTAGRQKAWFFEGLVQALGSTTSQLAAGYVFMGDDNPVPTGYGKLADPAIRFGGPFHSIDGAVSMAASRALILEATHSGTGCTMSCKGARVEVAT